MSAALEISAAIIEEARHLKAGGMSWYMIGKELGYHCDVLHRRVDPTWGNHLSTGKHVRRSISAATIKPYEPPPPLADRLKEYHDLASRPRSIGSVLMGDPLPGRSALDRMHDQ